MSRPVGMPETRSARDIARHIRSMAMLVRGAADLARTKPAPKGFPKGGCASGGCSTEGCSTGGCSTGGDSANAAAEPPHEEEAGRGWWVLAQGGALDESDFSAREAAREALLERVRRAGILVGENVWVWDLSRRAQLVLTTLPTLERARKLAQRLRAKGLAIVIRREMP
ncbi:MAG: hypothetical protein Q7I92_02195 [Humidesulfovibrio sp.]|nr:hypothetical protein [Humidesulfovibrio sp.]